MKICTQFQHAGIIFLLFLLPAIVVQGQTPGFRAVNDTIDLYPFIPVVFDILANDSIPAGDSIRRVSFFNRPSRIHCWNDSNRVFTFRILACGRNGLDSCSYRVILMSGDTSIAKVLFMVHDHSFAYLSINNVSARFSASGNHFFDEDAEYEVPRGSGKTSIFSNALWIGGLDQRGDLHFAGERYRQGPAVGSVGTKFDFFAGPVMDSPGYSIYQDTVWNRIWNLKKSDIDYHRAHYWEPGYVPLQDILSWPGNGDTSLGQAFRLAPFSDRNADGIYEPFDGDYPEIRGDQALFFIFNDDRGPHTETEGKKLRMEIHGMAYAFDLPDDSALKNTVFLNYTFYNRSQHVYDSTLVGIFTDLDLGWAKDDFLGCDVERSMYFAYNGDSIDGDGQPEAYGAHPPVQAVTILAGPFMDPDGFDNPRVDEQGNQLCDYSINGINFGDSVVDNERYGMCRFTYFNNSLSGVPVYMTDPAFAKDYYDILKGLWNDGTPVIYGGNGHPLAGGYGPSCRFMYPGDSDSLDWGPGCQPPNGPRMWTEETAGNIPMDRRAVGVTGPFTFHPGEVQEIDISFNWARDCQSPTPQGSLDKLRDMVDVVREVFETNTLPNGLPFSGVPDLPPPPDLRVSVYPNPVRGMIHLEFQSCDPAGDKTIDLLTLQGVTLKKFIATGNQKTVNLELTEIPTGMYLLRIKTQNQLVTKKILVIR